MRRPGLQRPVPDTAAGRPDQPSQGPGQRGEGDLLAWRHGSGQVLTPHVASRSAAVVAVPNNQDGPAPAERCVADPAGHHIPWRTFGSALSAPWIQVVTRLWISVVTKVRY